MKSISINKKVAILKVAVGSLMVAVMGVSLLTGCTTKAESGSSKLKLVATTTMLTDLAQQIGGDKIAVEGLMGAGIDPHSYKPTAGDVTKLQGADIALVNGLHLEGKMTDVFDDLKKVGKTVINLEENIDKSKFHEEEANVYDPHIWFEVALWKDGARAVEKTLSEKDNANKEIAKI